MTSPSRDPKSHLVLIVSTRSSQKTHQVITRLRKHLRFTAEKSSTARYLQKHAIAQGRDYDWRDVVARVHFLGVELDLCNMSQIYDAAARIKGERGGLGTPGVLSADGQSITEGLKNITIPRLDVVVLNAGIGGWQGIKWFTAVYHVITDIVEAVTWWEDWIFPQPTAVTKQQTPINNVGSKDHLIDGRGHVDDVYHDQPKLGEIFCANVFGHYVLGHELMPLLYSTKGREAGDRGRIIWITSVEGLDKYFNVDDIQGFKAENPYSSTKRLIDYICLTYSLPSVRNISSSYFSIDEPKKSGLKNGNSRQSASARNTNSSEEESNAHVQGEKPELYLLHPGICATAIAGINWFLALFMISAFYIARWMGSPWHPIRTYSGACGPVWAILASQSLLDTLEQFNGSYGEAKTKWGTATDFWGNPCVKKMETPGYGWTGKIGEENDEGWEGTRKGRKRDTPDLTPELRAQFEETGREAWIQLEEMRKEWEVRLGVRNSFKY